VFVSAGIVESRWRNPIYRVAQAREGETRFSPETALLICDQDHALDITQVIQCPLEFLLRGYFFRASQ
jgi:hypothetical protein